MQQPGDVTAFSLQEAQEALEEAGWQVACVRHTSSPRGTPAGGTDRVLRQRVVGPGQVELVVAKAPDAPPGAHCAP